MVPLPWRRVFYALLLAPLLAARAWTADVEAPNVAAASVALYPAPHAWTAALPQVAQLAKIPGLAGAQPQALAPVAFELSQSLGVTPEEFVKMDDHDRASAVQLAVEAARQDLLQKSYELVGRSKRLVFSNEGVTKADLDELYPVAMQLREIDKNYGPLLEPRERENVAASAAQTAASWREARAAYIKRFGEAQKKALADGTRDEEAVSVEANAPPRLPKFTPGQAAREIYEAMRRNRYGDYGQSDYATLFKGYGFTYRDSGGHRVYTFEKYPRLSMPVPRHNLKPYLVAQALDLIDRRMELSEPPPKVPALAKSAVEDEDLPPPPAGVSAAFRAAAAPKQVPSGASLAQLSPEDAPPAITPGARPKTAPAKSPRRGPPEATLAKAQPVPPAPKAPQPPAPTAPAKTIAQQAVQGDFVPVDDLEPASKKLPWWQRAYRRLKGE